MPTCRLCGQMDLPFTAEWLRPEDADSPVFRWFCFGCTQDNFDRAMGQAKFVNVFDQLPGANRYTERDYNIGNRWKK